jgi:hypothetical protein
MSARSLGFDLAGVEIKPWESHAGRQLQESGVIVSTGMTGVVWMMIPGISDAGPRIGCWIGDLWLTCAAGRVSTTHDASLFALYNIILPCTSNVVRCDCSQNEVKVVSCP